MMISLVSQNDKKFLDIASSGLTVTPGRIIEIPLPLQSSNIPDNKATVYMRTKATLSRLKSQPEKLHAFHRVDEQKLIQWICGGNST